MSEFASIRDHDDGSVATLNVLPRDKQLAHDLRGTLIHECGHLIVGDHVGVEKSYVDLWLHEDAAPLDEKLVLGRAFYFPRLRGRNEQLMGVAGIVAESLAENLTVEEYFCSWTLLDNIDNDRDALSATDLKKAGEIDMALLDECAGILRRHWPDLIAEAVHQLEHFVKRYADDEDVAKAASFVRVELEKIASRFQS